MDKTGIAQLGSRSGRLLLLDSASMWFRAFHGVPASVTAPDGTPVNAVRGFLDVCARMLTESRPALLVACLDADWRPAFRVAALPSYKAHRVAPDGGEAVPEGLAHQVDILQSVLRAFAIPTVGAAGFEADDVIAAYTARHPGPVDIVTGDRDLFQLVDDSRPVRILYSVERYRPVTEEVIAEKYAIPGRAYAGFAVLRGDPSDGLPGVPGVGAKTASALLERFGSLGALLAVLDNPDAGDAGFPAGARTRLLAARDYLTAARAVVEARTDLELPGLAVPGEPDVAQVAELAQRWGLESPVARLAQALTLMDRAG